MLKNKLSKSLITYVVKVLVVAILGTQATIFIPVIAQSPTIKVSGSQPRIIQSLIGYSPADYKLDDKSYYKYVLYQEVVSAKLSYADYKKLAKVVQCESSWNYEAIGDSGKARSLAQFHKPTFDMFSDKADLELEYKDPEDQLKLLVWAYKNKQMSHWTCWQLTNYGTKVF